MLPMAIRPFKYHMHDSSFHEVWDDPYLTDQLKLEEEGWTEEEIEALAQKIGKPFYEVTLQCELDDETGEVKIVSAH